jgi:hypothetical protein
MNDRTRLGAAVLGGYLLGRTKKGTTAVRLAMWLNGTSTGSLAKDGLQRLTNSPEVSKFVSQAGQPLVQAARNAAIAAVEARLSGLAAGLNQRTSRLLPQGPGEGEESESEGGAEAAGGDSARQQHDDTESPDEDGLPEREPADDRGDRAESEMDTGSATRSNGSSASKDSGDESDDEESRSDEEPAAAREGRSGKPPEARKAPARGTRTGSTRQREKAAS